MLKIRFKEYSILYKKQYFKILIPAKPIEQLWITPYARDETTFWDGNRFAFQTLYEATKIMSCTNKVIIYFPLRQSKYKDYLYKGQHYDMVWMNNQNTIRNSDLKYVLSRIRKKNNIHYFDGYVRQKCEELINQNGKEYRYNLCPFEVEFNDIMVYRLPRFFYANMTQELHEYLHHQLEHEYLKNEMGNIFPYAWLGGNFYSKQKYYDFYVELGFIDIQLEKRKDKK